jgi:hypothetical protein
MLLVIQSMLFVQGCDRNFEELNTNPDAISKPTVKYIFSKALYDGARYSGNTPTLLLGTMQYTTSYNDVAGFGSKYVAARSDLSYVVFNNAFPNQINEIGEVIKAVKDDPTLVNLHAIARIWRVFCFSRITDLYGDIPYSQAAKGYSESIFQPSYDSQQDIYANMLQELDEAAESLDAENSITFGASDLIYNGNTDQWKKFAYSLMLRLGMRLTEADASKAQLWVTKAIAGGVITQYDDIAKIRYEGSGQDINKNPMALIMLNDDYIKADGSSNTEGGKYQQVFIDSLKDNNDPRLSVISVVYVNGVADATPEIQKGMASNINGGKPAEFGTYSEPKQTTVLRLAAPLLLFTAAESNFLLAEANLRGWYAAETADVLYEKAIREAMHQWDLISGVNGTIASDDVNSYVAAHPLKPATVEGQKEQIYTQFWMSIFPDAQEVFANYRRTGYPALTPNNYPGNATGGQIFRRFLYPTSEQTLNTASYKEAIARQGDDNFMTKIWWDK